MTDNSAFSTNPFTTSPAVYIRCLLGMWFKRYGVWVVLPVIICAVLGAVADIRWFIAAMMIVFLLTPMLLAYLYFYYMLTPEARRAIMPMQLALHADGALDITYQPLPDSDTPAHAPEHLPAGTVKRTILRKRHLALVLSGPRLAFILVPKSALIR